MRANPCPHRITTPSTHFPIDDTTSHMPRFGFVILLLGLAPLARAEIDPATLTYVKDIQPLLQTSCGKCHLGEHTKGDISLAPFTTDDAVQADPRLWRTVLTELGDYSM